MSANWLSEDIRSIQLQFQKQPKVKWLVLGSYLSCIAALLQATGGLLPVVGFFISPFATLPILIGTMFFLQIGVISYFLSISLLFILFPSELIVFPFTTGILGLGIGVGFYLFKEKLNIISLGAILLALGIICLLYILQFPVLGPIVSHSFSFLTAGSILLFSFFYSWLWVEMAPFFFKKFKPFLD
ncbi:hypothetical protein ABE65_011175 [Fictibacillus phosphorivorans]|uniref:Uncharacterized protein n=1 Tax=Fictibacillus phosphorivorans TaxID=1221500 RepID=A0A160IME7_9BACL|nr:hypothetical protein [Fictibacillus phosphorivorans]ANC77334.1 hypothetical protein ABE65_011175 [Fictibacillus phosphorivorans]